MTRVGIFLFFTMLIVAPPMTQAEIVWEGDFHTFRYAVEKNGGNFIYAPQEYFSSSDNTAVLHHSPPLSAPYDGEALGELTEFPDPVPGAIHVRGMARGPMGGISPPHGTTVQAFAEILPLDLDGDHGAHIEQKIVCWATRRLTVSSGGAYRLEAALKGMVDFSDFGSTIPYLGTHSVEGIVEILEDPDGPHIRTVAFLLLSETDRNETEDVILQAGSIYQLKAVLTMNTKLVNFSFQSGVVAALPAGKYKLGKTVDPMTLNAIIHDPSQDADRDGIPDAVDNCPQDDNLDQADFDGDGVGDVCDNCPMVFNPDQADSQGSGVGDRCNLKVPDAILIFQVLAGLEPDVGDLPVDVSGDGKLGFEDAIFALQNACGLR